MTYQVFAVIILVCIYLATVAVSIKPGPWRAGFIASSMVLFSALITKVIIEIVRAIQTIG